MAKAKSTGRRVVGRPKSYTPQALRTAVNKYFLSISREREIFDKIPDGKDKDGKTIYKQVRVMNGLGEPATEIEYFVRPSIAGLCAFLRIHRDTWNNYSHNEEYRDICAAASGEIEAYLCSRLGSGKGDSGIIFDLTHNYNWKNRIEIEAGESTRRSIENIPRTMGEKLKFLKEHGYDIPGAGEDEYDSDEDDER